MQTLDKINHIEELKSLFDNIGIGIIFLDKNFKILAINNAVTSEIINCKSNHQDNFNHCYSLLGKKGQCDDCPFKDSDIQLNSSKSYTFKDSAGKNTFISVKHHSWLGYHVLTLHNVTKEITLLKKIDLNRKEAEAKNILLDRRWKKSHNRHKELKNIIDYLPDALVTVNKNFLILNSNQAVTDVLNVHPPGQCYELFGNDSPCHDCPAQDGFTAEKHKIKHLLDDKYYTEIISQAPDGEGGILLFSETTKQIELIEQIKQQQDTLSGLIDLADIMQKEVDIRTVLNIFLDKLLPAISADAAILLINEIRSGNLWQTVSRNVTDKEITQISKLYLSREIQCSRQNKIPGDKFPWESITQISLKGAANNKVGLLCLPGEFIDTEREKVFLFAKSLGAYIDNKLLMRQLEEKADTDQMTGLYNRGYIDKIIIEEQNKLKRYNINYAIIAVDINSLKKANDIYGHEAGDLLITTVAESLQKSLRETDIVARIGGDEFLILLTNTGDKGARTYISRLRQEFFTDKFITIKDNISWPVTVSLGCAGTDKFQPAELKSRADENMYMDKEEFYKTTDRYR